MSKDKKRAKNAGFLNFDDFETQVVDNIENDPSLEAELLELIGGGGVIEKKSKPVNYKKDMKPITIDKNLLNLDLNEDINDGELDENDPELVAELNSFLKEENISDGSNENFHRSSTSEIILKLEGLKTAYGEGIKQAQVLDNQTKARRFDRSLKLINELLQKALKGETVNESEFPPMINVSDKPIKVIESAQKDTDHFIIEPPVKSSKIQSPIQEKKTQGTPIDIINILIQRQIEYKQAAMENRSKDTELAKGLMIVFKQFDLVINNVKNGQQFDLDELPPHPSEFKLSDLSPDDEEEVLITESVKPLGLKSFEEELQLRCSFYRDSAAKAKSEGNESKSRRLARVIQQYEEAIDSYKKKRQFSYDELPVPPGRPPLTNQNTQPSEKVVSGNHINPAHVRSSAIPNKPEPIKNVSKNTKFLQDKQIQFRTAALKAKQEGNLVLAKELLRQSKGFDQMIDASESGLPLDLSKIPLLPNEKDYGFEIINESQCEIPHEMLNVSKETLLKQLQVTLIEQIKTCKMYESVVSKAGDIISAKRFDNLAKSCEKDLNGLKCLIQKNAEIPKFHYEYKTFTILQSNPDLAENEMSVEIIKGADFGLPDGYSVDQFDSYVVLELPFPNDAFQTFTTETVRKSTSPLYNSLHKFQVNLKSRVFQRVCKSKHLKADIYYRKGFLQKDKLYGSTQVKLEKLETHCSIHERFDIMENRKLVAGKLEIKIRVRNPLLSNQSENIKEKWLVIDEFNIGNLNTESIFQPTPCNDTQEIYSIDVLKFEIGDIKRKLATNGSLMSMALVNLLKQKLGEKESSLRKQEEKLKSSNPSVTMGYLQSISKLPQEFNNEAKKYLMESKRDKAQIAITKKKIVEREIEQLKESRLKS